MFKCFQNIIPVTKIHIVSASCPPALHSASSAIAPKRPGKLHPAELSVPRHTSCGRCALSSGQSWNQVQSLWSRSSLPALRAEPEDVQGAAALSSLSRALLAWLQAVGGERWVKATVQPASGRLRVPGSLLTAWQPSKRPSHQAQTGPTRRTGCGWTTGSWYKATSSFYMSAQARRRKEKDAPEWKRRSCPRQVRAERVQHWHLRGCTLERARGLSKVSCSLWFSKPWTPWPVIVWKQRLQHTWLVF